MIADSMVSLVKNSSVIRAMFEEGKRMAAIYGKEVTLMFQHLQRLMKQLRI